MRKLMILTAAVAALSTPVLSQAKGVNAPDPASSVGGGCQASASTLQTAGMIGALGGGFLGKTLGGKTLGGKLPGGSALAASLGVFVADRVACMLNTQERAESERATLQAVDQGVGAQTSWRSPSRPNVRGAANVIAETHEQDGSLCRNVSDVVVVNGEESTVNKRLCRAPGASGFVLAV